MLNIISSTTMLPVISIPGNTIWVPQVTIITFTDQVYNIVRSIPPGQTLTYKQVAEAAGNPGAARSVGTILKNNPYPMYRIVNNIVVSTNHLNPIPCHRVIPSNGSIYRPGGFFGRDRSRCCKLQIEHTTV